MVNMIGFSFQRHNYSNWRPSKSCPFCHCILIPKRDETDAYEPNVLQCPECGAPFLEHEAPAEEGIKSKHGKTRTAIISAKNKSKKYYDKQGNEINDPDLIQDIIQGKTVISYHEDKIEPKDILHIHKRNKKVVRSGQVNRI